METFIVYHRHQHATGYTYYYYPLTQSAAEAEKYALYDETYPYRISFRSTRFDDVNNLPQEISITGADANGEYNWREVPQDELDRELANEYKREIHLELALSDDIIKCNRAHIDLTKERIDDDINDAARDSNSQRSALNKFANQILKWEELNRCLKRQELAVDFAERMILLLIQQDGAYYQVEHIARSRAEPLAVYTVEQGKVVAQQAAIEKYRGVLYPPTATDDDALKIIVKDADRRVELEGAETLEEDRIVALWLGNDTTEGLMQKDNFADVSKFGNFGFYWTRKSLELIQATLTANEEEDDNDADTN